MIESKYPYLGTLVKRQRKNPAHRHRYLGRARNAGLGYPTRTCCDSLLAACLGSLSGHIVEKPLISEKHDGGGLQGLQVQAGKA